MLSGYIDCNGGEKKGNLKVCEGCGASCFFLFLNSAIQSFDFHILRFMHMFVALFKFILAVLKLELRFKRTICSSSL